MKRSKVIKEIKIADNIGAIIDANGVAKITRTSITGSEDWVVLGLDQLELLVKTSKEMYNMEIV